MSKGRIEGADDWERDVSILTRAAFRIYQRKQQLKPKSTLPSAMITFTAVSLCVGVVAVVPKLLSSLPRLPTRLDLAKNLLPIRLGLRL